MAPRSSFRPTADAPIRRRLVVVWGLFFAFVAVGVGLFLWQGDSLPVLLDLMSR